MKLKKKGNVIYDENNRALVRYVYYGKERVIERTPGCTIGEYFAVLTWLLERNEQVTSK